MSRYSQYFLQHTLWLDDGFCKYYVQDRFWCRQDVTDVPCVIFNFRDEAETWLQQCVKNDWDTTVRRLRSFLVYESFEHLQVHRLNDREVITAAARQLTLQVHKVVIEPKFGLAVKVDAATQEPLLPLAVEPASELDLLFRQIRQSLDALLAAQRKSYDQIEATLAKMSPAQRDVAYAKAAGKGLVVDALDGMVDLVKSLPALIWSLLKKEWRIITFPQRLATSAAYSTVALSRTPLEEEIHHALRPFTQTGRQAEKLARIMFVLLGDDECFTLLMDFARRYWDATHPLEKTRIAASLFSDIVLTIIFALISAGVGAVANVIAKSQWLVKCAAKLEELALLLKRIGHRHKLPRIGDEIAEAAAADMEKAAARIESKGGHGMPEPQTPKKGLDIIDDSGKKNYAEGKDFYGPETKAKKYKNKPPTIEDISLAKKPGKAAQQIAARKKVASHFYEKQGFDPDIIPAHLEGVDLNHPVEVVKLTEGTKLKQLQIPGAPQGNYYTTPDTPANKLGTSLKVKHKETGEIIERIEGRYIVKKNTEAISSTTADIVDNWSIPGENIPTKGGGKQYFSTDKISIEPIE